MIIRGRLFAIEDRPIDHEALVRKPVRSVHWDGLFIHRYTEQDELSAGKAVADRRNAVETLGDPLTGQAK